jgi:ABC-2 type transport system permease protein
MKAFHIWRRELGAYFRTPLGYVVLCVFFVLAGHFFYSDLLFFALWGGDAPPAALWTRVFLDLRLVLLLVIPVVTMRLFAEERRLGTLELLWTYPATDAAIVAGKFLASVSFVVLMLAPTLAYPALLAVWYPIDVAPLAAGYLGLFALGIAFVACGMAASSATDSQVVAAVAAYGTLLLFWFGTWNEAVASEAVMRVLLLLSLFDRFQGFARGVIDTRDVAYFALFTSFFLFMTVRILQRRSWRGL